jgi:hypothetical protein
LGGGGKGPTTAPATMPLIRDNLLDGLPKESRSDEELCEALVSVLRRMYPHAAEGDIKVRPSEECGPSSPHVPTTTLYFLAQERCRHTVGKQCGGRLVQCHDSGCLWVSGPPATAAFRRGRAPVVLPVRFHWRPLGVARHDMEMYGAPVSVNGEPTVFFAGEATCKASGPSGVAERTPSHPRLAGPLCNRARRVFERETCGGRGLCGLARPNRQYR